jgi:hypothetical protein
VLQMATNTTRVVRAVKDAVAAAEGVAHHRCI